MSYKKLSNCWAQEQVVEEYNPVTIPYSDYQQYLGSGDSVIDGSGGVKLGPGNSSVVLGPVRQNPFTAGMVSNKHYWSPIPNNTAGLGWIN